METPRPPLLIRNVRLALHDHQEALHRLFAVQCLDGMVNKILEDHESEGQFTNESLTPVEECVVVNGKGGMLLPSFCHAHIHLDKCNILSQCDDLVLGTFQEALTVTAKAKATFTDENLLSRGRELILESVKYGTTSMRAHVEVDTTVYFKCVDVGLQLKHELNDLCDIGIAVFAQEALYTHSDRDTSENLDLLREAAAMSGISAVGSAPYVEASVSDSHKNIDDILEISLSLNLHVDFHLDYDLSRTSSPLIHYVIRRLRELDWAGHLPDKRVTIGHATHLSLFSSEELVMLHDEIKDLPITFVGLPQSDMYMMGRDDPARPRGTLHVPDFVRHGLDVAISVNNVGNAFTPQGSLDPLGLCTFGVAVYQSGTLQDCRVLLEAVSITSRRAAGFSALGALKISEGDPADLVLVHGNDNIQALVFNPGYERTVIKGGRVVARRTAIDLVAHHPAV